ncbi:MAG: hypothetical protein QXX64_01305 [Nitrososphaera sp.]|uniref:Uncharacterized protein n=1 Tax=Nitrososphaera gargensis (strain Ga9.2) TaxID=1237085 RepID=K0INJ6_NITGG|nr:hypothetical protein [Candidatus Nitrososphaera gargensis]AFU59489.1 hypothetical protein Ngar_c25670 [Candidatus Nitrososphaera gargensis Ga9.2]
MMNVPALLLLLLALSLLVVSAAPAYAHFDHLTHYNSRGGGVGQYYVYEALEPDYAAPGEPTAIMFSVQDYDGRDTYNIETMVEIYTSSGERIKAFPWTKQDVGDFQVFYTFPHVGSYQIVLSIADGPVNTNAIDLPRSTLGSTAGCNCERLIFNVAVSQGFGSIYNSTLGGAVFSSLAIFGAVLGLTYWSKKKSGKFASAPGDTMRYIVTLAAIAGGLVHFAVYSGHASLRLEYSIFLIVAGGMQVTYGILYTLLTLTGSTTGRARPHEHYRKTVAVNLFGLIGTAVLLGLYAYSVTLPPPLSPTGQPEDVDLAGILAKAVEVFTLIGIVYLMRLEKRRLQTFLKEHA